LTKWPLPEGGVIGLEAKRVRSARVRATLTCARAMLAGALLPSASGSARAVIVSIPAGQGAIPLVGRGTRISPIQIAASTAQGSSPSRYGTGAD